MYRVLAAIIAFAPWSAFAANTNFFGPIVPACAYTKDAICVACDLVALADNLLKIAVTLGVVAAVVMFAYAGILFVTASASAGNLDSARKLFGQVLIGLIFILAAFLIIDLTLRALTGQTFKAWTAVTCVHPTETQGVFKWVPGSPEEQQSVESPISGTQGAEPPSSSCTTNPLTHDDAMSQLQGKIHVTSSQGDGASNVNGTCSGWGCTTLAGVCSTSIDKILAINDAVIAAGCGPVEIRGGTERNVHLTAAQGGQHETGLAFDVTENDCLGTWIQQHGTEYGITQFCTTPGAAAKGFGFGGCAGHEPSSQPHYHFGF